MKHIDSIWAIAFITSAMLLSCSSENTDLPINPDKQVGAEYSEYKATIEPDRKFGLRIPIYGDATNGGHQSQGNSSVYHQCLSGRQNLLGKDL